MHITVFGTGYVGLVTAACFASHEHVLTCVDINAEKIEMLNKGISPIFEPNLSELLAENLKKSRMTFTLNASEAVDTASVIFIAVGTPENVDGSANLSSLYAVVEELSRHNLENKIIVVKSTVPVGTTDEVARLLSDKKCHVVFNPEFLRQGNAVYDFLNPDRVILGSDSPYALGVLKKIYKAFNTDESHILVMDAKSAEMTKYVANALLATKISFINEMSQLTSRLGADIEKVRQGISLDPRIGPHFINPGMGYGGSCFPKDTSALQSMAKSLGYETRILAAVDAVNEDQKLVLIEKIKMFYQGNVSGKTVAIWGLSFKPNTDDIRCASSIPFIQKLSELGVKVQAYDPAAMKNFQTAHGDIPNCILTSSAEAALEKADALCIVTEWGVFKSANLDFLKEKLKDRVIFDGRNIFDKKVCEMAGLHYYSV